MTLEELAKQIHAAQGGNWDGLEPDCGTPKECPDGIPYRMHRGYWLELAEKKLRLN